MAAPSFVVSLADLATTTGARRSVHREVALADLAVSTSAVPADAPVVVDADLEVIAGGLAVRARVRAPWRGECRRCLGEVSGELDATVNEIFEPRPTEGETYPLADDHVDLEPMVRDVVLLALPLAPLCAEGCAGPDPERFPARVDDASAPDALPPDPRWAALDELRFDGELGSTGPDE